MLMMATSGLATGATLSSSQIDEIVDELCPSAPVWYADPIHGQDWGRVIDNRGQLFTHNFTQRTAFDAGDGPCAVIGGIYAGADSRMRTGDWDLIHDQAGDPGDDCLQITVDAPGKDFLVSGCAFDSTFDPIAPSKGLLANQSQSTYLIEHCYARVVRDDFHENDGCLVGTMRSVLVDGAFMIASMRNPNAEDSYPNVGHTTLEEVYIRFSCLPQLGSNSSGCPVGFGGGGKLFKAGSKTGTAVHRRCLYLWEARSNNFTEDQSWRPGATYESVYVLYAPGGQPQPFFDSLPAGVTDLGSLANAYDVWLGVRDRWLNQHDCRPKDAWFGFTAGAGGTHPSMPNIGPIQDSWAYNYGPAASEVGPIEDIDPAALAIDIDVGTDERQTLIGYGWGAASINMSHWTAANVQKLCEDMGATVVRYLTAEGSSFLSDHLAHWNLISAHGIDTIFSGGFVYRTANTINSPPDIEGLADGIDAAMDGGINPSNGWWAGIQNESDGHADNHPTTDGVNTATQAQIRGHYVTLRNRLAVLGRNAVKLLGLELRHPESLTGEFDDFDANNLFANGVVQGQCFHIYNKGPRPEYYDQRIMLQGLNFFSTETGDNGNTGGDMSSPYTVARYISGLNNGVQVEIHHGAIGGVDGDGKVQVLLNSSDGAPRNWYQASKITSKHMIRGTVMRLCSSSDRPTSPTMPVTQATRMFIDSRTGSGGCLCQPRQFVGCGRRADGRWVLAANHFAYDTKVETTFAGGHYGDSGPQQHTVMIPELSTVDRVWSGQRATRSGGVGNTTVNMHDGLLRYTLVPGETIAITMDAA